MKKLLKYFDGYYKQLILGPSFKLFEAILELLIPLIMANIIDKGIANGDKGYIISHGALMLALGFVGLCFAITCQYFAAVCAQGFGRSLRRDLFRHIFSLSQAQSGKIGTDSLITRLTNDVNQVQTGVNMAIRLATRAPFLAVGSIVMSFTISPKIGSIFLISTPIIVFVLYKIMKISVPFYTQIQKKQDGISRLVGENLAGARVVRAFSREASEIEQFKESGDELSDATVRVGKTSALLNPLTYVIVNLAIVAIVWFGGVLANSGELQQGQIIALVNYMTQTFLALVVLANLIVIFTKAVASAGRVCEILEFDSDMDIPAVSKTESENAASVSFDGVSFAYNKSGDDALTDIDFALKTGETLGIIGGTGCGKTTIVNLILRYYDATKGAVLVNGVNVKDYTSEDLHAKIGLVPQTAMLFAGTVRSNLMLGAPNADDAQLWRALSTAQGKDFVEKLPQGLDSTVEEMGKNLSGGQRQRLTIARALAKNPQILVLDDSASALDYATDAALRKAIKSDTENMTVIMISQRASTLKDCDKILVLDDGAQVGLGTHAQLLAKCDVYKEICESQGIAQTEVQA